MKTKGLKKDKVNIITLGCSKNTVDSEVMLTQLKGNDVDAVHESQEEDANIIVVNTCGFIDNAKQESIDTILQFADAKTDGLIDKLYVTGCLSQRYRDSLEAEIPQVDAFFGTMELPLFLKKFDADYKHELLGERITTTSTHYSFLKIAEGCDRPCSFCAIPLMRGKHVSRPMDELLVEAKNLVKRGTKEIILIAQDLTFYGLDIYKKRNLSELLNKLADIDGLEWIRLQYAYPAGFPKDVLDVIRERDNICNYLDMPLQTGSTEVLKTMRRGITRPKTEELVAEIREKVPGIAIRTTLIVGHPGETEESHQETVDFVRRMKFDRLGVFTYSHEENTHAHDEYEDLIDEETKEARLEEIMEVQQQISLEINSAKVGKQFKVLIDRKEGQFFIGRTEHDSPEVDNEVLIEAEDNYLRIGDFVNVEVYDATDYDLYGSVVTD